MFDGSIPRFDVTPCFWRFNPQGTSRDIVRELQSINLSSRNIITFNSMMDAFGKGGEWKRALSLLEERLEGKSYGVDVIGFNAAISACEEAAKWEEALELLKNLQEADALQADVTLASIHPCLQVYIS